MGWAKTFEFPKHYWWPGMKNFGHEYFSRLTPPFVQSNKFLLIVIKPLPHLFPDGLLPDPFPESPLTVRLFLSWWFPSASLSSASPRPFYTRPSTRPFPVRPGAVLSSRLLGLFLTCLRELGLSPMSPLPSVGPRPPRVFRPQLSWQSGFAPLPPGPSYFRVERLFFLCPPLYFVRQRICAN